MNTLAGRCVLSSTWRRIAFQPLRHETLAADDERAGRARIAGSVSGRDCRLCAPHATKCARSERDAHIGIRCRVRHDHATASSFIPNASIDCFEAASLITRAFIRGAARLCTRWASAFWRSSRCRLPRWAISRAHAQFHARSPARICCICVAITRSSSCRAPDGETKSVRSQEHLMTDNKAYSSIKPIRSSAAESVGFPTSTPRGAFRGAVTAADKSPRRAMRGMGRFADVRSTSCLPRAATSRGTTRCASREICPPP